MTASSRQLCMVLGALLSAGLFVLSLQASRAWGQDPGEGAKARLIVTYEDGATEEADDGAVGAVKVEAEGEISEVNAEVVSVPEAASSSGDVPEGLRRAKEKLEDEPGVATVEYDHAREASYSPGDPGLSDQWGLKKTGFRSAWDATRGEGVRIAVVDSGVANGHPDLSGKVVAQKDFVNEDGSAEDDFGHGTHVAGIVAARTGNGTGISGGCPGCELLVAKTIEGSIGYDSDVAEGIIWAADNGADVINLSLTGPAPSDVLKRAVDYAWNEGAVVAAAAGNSGDGTVQYPAAYSNAIAVAATTRSDGRASFSTIGDWVDVSAPGVDVLSTLPGGYGYMNGTSMATPHVAALAGLLADEGLSNEQIKNRIVSNTVDLGPDGRDLYFGTGRIDAARALNRPAPQPPAPEPEPEEGPDAPPDNGGDNQRTLASDDDPQPREKQATPLPKKPEPRPAAAANVKPPAAEPPKEQAKQTGQAKPAQQEKSAQQEPEPSVREAPPDPPAVQEAPAAPEPPRELVFQNDEELEEKFRRAEEREQAAAPVTEEDGCAPAATSSVGGEQEGGLLTAMIDGLFSAVHSALESLGLVSGAEAEEASSLTPCTETAQLVGKG